jgi:IS30 family transposase
MMTLRERKTQYGIIINLAVDHTAESVKNAVIKAFAGLSKRMRRMLTWDQETEMYLPPRNLRGLDLKIYFAERSSPWQRVRTRISTGSLDSISRRAPICRCTVTLMCGR